MIVDLHNHTKLCKHASGEMQEYIEKAVSVKTKYFGFSDHAPMDFDEKYRLSFNEMNFYESEVKRLRDVYKNDIEILLGYEVDYLIGHMDKRVLKADVDYLIGSVHFLNGWGFDNPEFIKTYKNIDIDNTWEEYFKAVEDMSKSGLFDIVGHIDLMKVFNFYPKKDIKILAKNAIKAIKKANMTIEINSAGLRKPCKEFYPGAEIMELIAEFDIPITFGSDAHKPEDVGYKSDKVLQYAKNYGYCQCALFHSRNREMINF